MSYATFEQIFDRTHYPAGERHVRVRSLAGAVDVTTIEATVTNFEDLCDVVVADRILRRNDIVVEWFLPYFPFARHDRRTDIADGLEIELALELVQSLKIVIADPHSEVAGVLPHISQMSTVDIMRTVGAFGADPIVVIPDAGAAKKATQWLAGSDSVQALKRRDPLTGHLSGFHVVAEGLDGRPCIIVDDICDGGGTFLGLADLLRSVHDAGPLTLIVTHGLFTKGLEALTSVFDHIFCFTPTNELDEPTTTGRLTQLPFRVLYEKGTRQ